jgi:hypothetical protein
MAEFLFVLKSFVITCVVVFCLQMKIGEQTLDHRLNQFLQKGQLTSLLRDAGQGATRLTASAYNSAKESDLKLPFQAMKGVEKAKQDMQKRQIEVQQELEEITSE